MHLLEWILTAAGVLGVPTLVGLVVHGRMQNRVLLAQARESEARAKAEEAQAGKTSADAGLSSAKEVEVYVGSALQLVGPLRDRIRELEGNCDSLNRRCLDLQSQVDELTREVEHQRQIVNETTSKLETANARAEAYRRAFEDKSS